MSVSDFMPDVYISLTTIPSRLPLIKNNENLFSHDYPNIKKIFITLPMNNMRGQKSIIDLPDWLSAEPFLSKVTVLRPEKDYGPIMKYIGAIDVIPKDAYVFICDDDRYFKTDFISRCVKAMSNIPEDDRKKSLVNGYELFDDALGFYKSMFHIDLLYGYGGILVHKEFLDYVKSCPIDSLSMCCLRNDDDVVSVWARDKGYKKIPIQGGSEKNQQQHDIDALSTSYNRTLDRHKCQATINTQYADGLLTAIIILASLSLFFLLVFIVFFILYMKKRGKLLEKIQKESPTIKKL